MNILRTALLLTLSFSIVGSAIAEDAPQKGEKGKAAAAARKGDAARKRGERKAPGITARFVAKLDLSAEQKEKIAAIDKEFAAKFMEVRKAQISILTKEQVETRNAAMKKARESKDPAARKAVQEAIKLTDDQKKKMVEVGKTQKELYGKVLAALKNVLTEEQQKNLPKAGRRGTGKRPDGAKRPAGDRKKKDGKGKKGDAPKAEAK